jgi:hypothetical protein
MMERSSADNGGWMRRESEYVELTLAELNAMIGERDATPAPSDQSAFAAEPASSNVTEHVHSHTTSAVEDIALGALRRLATYPEFHRLFSVNAAAAMKQHRALLDEMEWSALRTLNFGSIVALYELRSAAPQIDTDLLERLDLHEVDITHTFETRATQTVDCVRYEAHPAVRRRLLAGIAHDPTDVPAPPPAASNAISPNISPPPFDGSLDRMGRVRLCPIGSVPIVRPTQIARQQRLESARTKARLPKCPPYQSCLQNDVLLAPPPGSSTLKGPGYDHAAGVFYPDELYGGSTITPVYSPFVAVPDAEHSLSQLWIHTGDCEEWAFKSGRTCYSPFNPPPNGDCATSPLCDASQTIEVGWIAGNQNCLQADECFMVPASDNDAPFLFVFSTIDGYGNQWCFAGQENTDFCLGTNFFIPSGVYAGHAPNVQLPTTSTIGKPPVELQIQVWFGRSPKGGLTAWWIFIDGALIGYYPADSFWGMMQSRATYMQVGGEVSDTFAFNQHTTTTMGSGKWAKFGCGFSAYHRNVMYASSPQAQHKPVVFEEAALEFITNAPKTSTPDVYTLNPEGISGYEAGDFYQLIQGAGNTDWGSHFFFGGNGGLHDPPNIKIVNPCGPTPIAQRLPLHGALPPWWHLIPTWDGPWTGGRSQRSAMARTLPAPGELPVTVQ